MNVQEQLLNQFIIAARHIDAVIIANAAGLKVSPHVSDAIFTAKKLLPILEDFQTKNCVVGILHDIYYDLRQDIKARGTLVNGQKHPALEPGLQAYRIIIS